MAGSGRGAGPSRGRPAFTAKPDGCGRERRDSSRTRRGADRDAGAAGLGDALPGRIFAARNALAGLLAAAGGQAKLAELDRIAQACEDAGDTTRLVDFIRRAAIGEGDAAAIAADETQEASAVFPSDSGPAESLEEPAALPASASRRADARRPRTEREPASGGARDRGVRVIKVTQEKVDRLMDLIGEMVVAKNALPYLAARAEEHFGSRELSREIKAQYAIIHRIAEEMQDGIMQVRMLPVGAIFQRFPRLVRDVARNLGKSVKLTVEGEQTEADKNIVESLADPLIHIIRNSLDHGIEAPDIRRAAGKPEEAG